MGQCESQTKETNAMPMQRFAVYFPAFSGDTLYCHIYHDSAADAVYSLTHESPDLQHDFRKHTGRDIAATDLRVVADPE